MLIRKIKVGDIYDSCDDHPVLCTEATGHDVWGISLLDGSFGHSCDLRHCKPRKMTTKAAYNRNNNKEEILQMIEDFRKFYADNCCVTDDYMNKYHQRIQEIDNE